MSIVSFSTNEGLALADHIVTEAFGYLCGRVFSCLARSTLSLATLFEQMALPPPTAPKSTIAVTNDRRNIVLTHRETQLALGVLLRHNLVIAVVYYSPLLDTDREHKEPNRSSTSTTAAGAKLGGNKEEAGRTPAQASRYLYAACVDEALLRLRYRSFTQSVQNCYPDNNGKTAVIMDMLFRVTIHMCIICDGFMFA